jgi:hypothetical protein
MWDAAYIKIIILLELSNCAMGCLYLSIANQKRKQALLRSNLPAI